MNIKSLLKKQTVTEAALLISVVLFLSKFFGFFREILVARYFGATGVTDAFLVAMSIPVVILGLFSSGLNTLIIPVYVEKKAADPAAARGFVNSVFTAASALFLFISLLVFIFAPVCVRIFAYGFEGERFHSAVTLTRLLAFSGVFTVLAGLLTGLLQSEKQFLAPALAGFAGNAALVACLFLLAPRLGIHAWTAGQISMAVVTFTLLFILLYRRYAFFHSLAWRGIDWKEMGRFAYLLVPLVVASGVSFINAVVDKAVASGLDEGSIAALNFSARVWGIPITLLAVPIATAVFPSFSELAVAGADRSGYADKLSRTLSVTFFFIIPASVLLFFVSAPVVRLFFERGAFDPAATSLTAAVNRMYVIGLFAHAAAPVVARAFYSFKNTLTPLAISVACVSLNVVLNIALSRLLGAPGIALATTIVMTANFILFGHFLKRYVPVLTKALAVESFKIVLASAPVAVICVLARPLFFGSNAATLHGFASLLIRLAAVGAASALAFLAAAALLKVKSLALARDLAAGLLARLLKKSE
jgi:putative peptidoglycan lipid II flippase